ncbi:glycosyltransferase family 4 protein [Donghicola mangrovi]|uniref:Glycosyltransferase family 4 protein n=1 Tax=Donghicola mangrovi TaxID=2729614 RepID=A0A850Q9E9_9RHOB|nr:glycosyltransferase family 4 protein [Donghicola mangrovi]NVO23588.1 glycosyltransferase family 4 protein [Donghicola mangrovi]
MGQIRILFPYTGDSVGGSHISSLTLARALPRDRFEPVVAVHDAGPLDGYLRGLDMPWLDAPHIAYPDTSSYGKQIGRYMRALPALVRFIKQHKINVVHTHDIRMHLSWSVAARIAGVPHVWHQRTPTSAKRLDRYTALSAKVIGVSEYCRAQFPPAMQARADVIYNPFEIPPAPNTAAARLALKQRLGLRADAQVVAYVANLAERKRPQFFVQIAKALREQGRHNLHFVMLGEAREPQNTEVQNAIEAAGLRGICRHMGPQYPILPWMAGADLMIAPAVHEALGRTMIEAQLLGTPLLASDHGGNPEIIGHIQTGLLAPADDLEAFTAAAAQLLDDPELAGTLTANARASAEAKFSLNRHLTQMLAVYDALPRR